MKERNGRRDRRRKKWKQGWMEIQREGRERGVVTKRRKVKARGRQGEPSGSPAGVPGCLYRPRAVGSPLCDLSWLSPPVVFPSLPCCSSPTAEASCPPVAG